LVVHSAPETYTLQKKKRVCRTENRQALFGQSILLTLFPQFWLKGLTVGIFVFSSIIPLNMNACCVTVITGIPMRTRINIAFNFRRYLLSVKERSGHQPADINVMQCANHIADCFSLVKGFTLCFARGASCGGTSFFIIDINSGGLTVIARRIVRTLVNTAFYPWIRHAQSPFQKI
jgi:hypothetical protein